MFLGSRYSLVDLKGIKYLLLILMTGGNICIVVRKLPPWTDLYHQVSHNTVLRGKLQFRFRSPNTALTNSTLQLLYSHNDPDNMQPYYRIQYAHTPHDLNASLPKREKIDEPRGLHNVFPSMSRNRARPRRRYSEQRHHSARLVGRVWITWTRLEVVHVVIEF